MKIFRNIKRIISQYFETEYWYRWRKIDHFWFNNDTGKYECKKVPARDYITCTWEGEKDILGIMLLKLDHMFWNLKHYAAQSDFYLDSHNITKIGSDSDKLYAFNKIIKEIESSKNEKEAIDCKYLYKRTDGGKEYRWFYGEYDNQKAIYLAHIYPSNGEKDYWAILDNGIYSNLQCKPDISNETGRKIIEGVIYYKYSVNVDITEYKNLSDELKPLVRGNRRTLTELLHLRHKVKQLYKIEDTDDKYYNMWSNIKDEDEKSKMLLESEKVFEEDRRKLYEEIAAFMDANGRCWWD